MFNSKLKNQIKHFAWFVSLFLVVFIIGCQSNKTDKASLPGKDFTDQLAAGSDIETIAKHLIAVRKEVGVTRALALNYPNLDLEKAYKIQLTMLSMLEEQSERLVGWKMGGSRVVDPNFPFAPVFGFMLASNEFHSGSTAGRSKFVPGYPLIEAEIGFTLKKDLPGPAVSRQDVMAAIDSVGGFSELISTRIRDANGGTKATSAQSIADGLSHGGFIQPKHKYTMDEVDLSKVKTSVVINGETKATGDSKGFAFIDALLYLANSLPKYGRHLRAGDIIITGSMLTPPPAKAGDHVEIKFSAFDPLSITFK